MPAEERIATFDQDGTLWVEHPIYTQVVYCLDRVPALAAQKPELKTHRAVQDRAVGRSAKRSRNCRCTTSRSILAATLTGMTVEQFEADVKEWLETAKDPRWNRLYTELTYQPMHEVHAISARATASRPISSPAAARISCASIRERVYGIPPEQVVGTVGGTKFGYDKDGKPFLTKEPKLLLNDDNAGKPEGIHMMIGRRPHAAFGNSGRRSADAGIYRGRRRRASDDAGAARRRDRANTPTARRADCPTAKSAHSRRRSTTKPRKTAGPSSA